MSRNSSGRSSYSYKSQEDFQDEILDLKRQLARLKEESRTLKVKLRRSEENAARKEKIICNMIDPLKAHLSAKSSKCQKKGSQKKEVQNYNKSTSALNTPYHSTCSRAYRHSAKSHEVLNGNHSQTCVEELTWSGRRKKCPSRVTTVIESIPEPQGESSEEMLLQPLIVKDTRMDNNASSVGVKNCGVSIKSVVNVPKNKEDVVSPVTSSNPKKGQLNRKNTKGKTKKKKSVADFKAKSLLFQLCASSENEEDSYSSYIAVDPLKSPGNVEVNHSASLVAGSIPHNSDNCKQCHFKCPRSLENITDNSVTQKIERLIKGGKNLLSTWNEDNEVNTRYLRTQGNQKSTCGERIIAQDNLSRGYGSNKYGMYLINERDEVEESGCADVTVADDESETLESWREVESKASPSCMIERRASIFRVDIKKKDANTESEGSQGVISFKDTNDGNGNCCKASKESCLFESINEEMGVCGVPMDADCEVMKTLLETLCVGDELSQNGEGKVNAKIGKCLRNTLENLLAATEVDDCKSKSAERSRESQGRTNVKELFIKPNSHKCSTGSFSSKFNIMHRNGGTILSNRDDVSHQGFEMNFYDEGVIIGGISLL